MAWQGYEAIRVVLGGSEGIGYIISVMPVVELGARVSCMWESVEGLCYIWLGGVTLMAVHCGLTAVMVTEKFRKVRVARLERTQSLTIRWLIELGV